MSDFISIRADADRALAMSRYQDAEHRVRQALAKLPLERVNEVAIEAEMLADEIEKGGRPVLEIDVGHGLPWRRNVGEAWLRRPA